MFQKLEHKVLLSGLSPSTLYNYGRSIAQIALHFRKLPLDLSDQSINEYLLELKAGKNPSESYFKHTVPIVGSTNTATTPAAIVTAPLAVVSNAKHGS